MKMRNSAVSITEKKVSAAAPPRPPQKVDFYRSFEEFEKKVTKLHLSENWQINSSSDYYQILKHDTIHDIPIFDTYIIDNLEFTIHVFAVCVPANHEIYMKFSKYVKISPYQIWFKKLVITVFTKVLKMKKIFNAPTYTLFQKYLIQMLQHHQHLQNFTDQLHVHIFAKLMSAQLPKI